MTGAVALLVLLIANPAIPAEPPMCPVPDARAHGVRVRASDPREAAPVRAFMRKVGAPGAPVENPCVAGVELGRSTCARTALEPFFSALDDTALRGARTGVVVFGNSLIAADGVTNVIRSRLVQQFTDGGRGLLLADRIGTVGPRARTANAASGWRAENCAYDPRPTAPLGATGVQHVSEGPAYSRFTLRGENHATIFWAGQAPLSLRVDDGPWVKLERDPQASTDDRGRAQVTHLELEPTQRTLTLRADRDGAIVQGVSLERGGGVVLDTLGVPSADAALWLGVDEDNFKEQLQARAPNLAVLMLGGNEAKRISWGRSTRESIDRDLRALIGRVRAATGAACLVVGPIDAVLGAEHEDPWRERSSLRDVIAIEREVALSEGCAFLDLYSAMGGKGSLSRLSEAGAMWDDYVHPRGRGLDMLGQLIVDALLDGYASSQPAAVVERRVQMTLGGT